MSGFWGQLWRLMKFNLVLGFKLWPRVTFGPFVAAFCFLWREAERTHAEVAAFKAKEFGDVVRNEKVR